MFFLKKYKQTKKSTPSPKQQQQQRQTATTNDSIHSQLLNNITHINKIFSDAPDLVIKQLTIKQTKETAALVYFSGLTDPNFVYNNALFPLQFEEDSDSQTTQPKVSIGQVKTAQSWIEIEDSILQGNSVLFIDGQTDAFIYSTQGFPQRAIEDSSIEPSLKGAHVGFTESAAQNIAMIRRYITNRELKINEVTVGTRGKTKVSILYLRDVANPDVLQELEDRIQQLDVDAVISSGVLAEYIEDNPYSPFPQLLITERPDNTAFHLLEGRIAVVVDKSPGVLVGPSNFILFFQSIDDYSMRWILASFLRLIRYIAFFIAIFLPATYIAIVSFHSEVIPVKLLISIGESRQKVPFQPFMEALMMELTLEMLREAGARLPAPIAQTVGIVGGIVIGQAAVDAGIVSNIMVIVVALTAVSSFIIPNYDMGSSIRLIRFPAMLFAATFGFLGLVIGFMIMIAHLIALESLGTPYGSPLAPLRWGDLKDGFIRFPEWAREKRPKSSRATQNKKAGSNHQKG